MENKRTLMILGASSDVGCDLIKRIHSNYDRIVAHYCTNREELDRLSKLYGDKLQLVQADLNDTDSVQRMLDYMVREECYAEHIVHLAAPKVSAQKFHKTEEKELRLLLESQVIAFSKVLKYNLPYMIKKKYGKIVVMLTAYTYGEPPAFLSLYTTSKYALLGLVKSLAVELASKGINVNAVSPEMIDTKFVSELPELVVRMSGEKSVMGRILRVEEVTPVFEYLLSEASDSVNGQNILISGVKRA